MGYSTGVIKIGQGHGAVLDADLILLQRIAALDQDALQELYERHAPGLLNYLVGRVGDARLAEEVLQDVMLAVWKNAGRFRGECRVRTWLLTIARRRAINAYHRQVVPNRFDVPLNADDQAIDDGQRSPGQYQDLAAALRSLPEEHRETLELVFFHGLSLDETARVLNVAPGTVKSRLHRAKVRLRIQMVDGSESDERTY